MIAGGARDQRLEGNHLANRVHQGRIGRNLPPCRLQRVRHVDDNHVVGPGRLPHGDAAVRLHRNVRERDMGCIDPEGRKRDRLLNRNRCTALRHGVR
eukprot:1163391-Prorocentrum_minimum.AAC.8